MKNLKGMSLLVLFVLTIGSLKPMEKETDQPTEKNSQWDQAVQITKDKFFADKDFQVEEKNGKKEWCEFEFEFVNEKLTVKKTRTTQVPLPGEEHSVMKGNITKLIGSSQLSVLPPEKQIEVLEDFKRKIERLRPPGTDNVHASMYYVFKVNECIEKIKGLANNTISQN